jgi:hypothetical protein
LPLTGKINDTGFVTACFEGILEDDEAAGRLEAVFFAGTDDELFTLTPLTVLSVFFVSLCTFVLGDV